MNKTADEAWAEWRAYTDAVDEEEELVRGIIEATAREIAREVLSAVVGDRLVSLELRVEDLEAELANDSTSGVGDDAPAPSEGEEGEVDEDMPPVVRYLLGSGPFDGLWYGDDPPQGVGRYWWRRSLRETVQRLQRERDKLKAKVFRLHERLDSRARIMTVRLERILDLEAENARLKREREAYADPRNWMPLSARYIGPDPDSTEADEGESVEGEVCGSWYIGLGGRGSPWPEGTRVRLIRLPDSPPEGEESDHGE